MSIKNFEFEHIGSKAGWKSLQDVEDFSLEYQANQISLSELIEACGDWFLYLKRKESDKWEVGSASRNSDDNAYGKTPEEAVAKLYLALNSR